MGFKIGRVLGAVATGGLSEIYRMQNRANQKAADRANAAQLEAWNMTNYYNTPKQQRERLVEAGYNPNLFYQLGNSGNASTLSTIGASPVDIVGQASGVLSGLAQIQGIRQANANIANIKANTDNTREQTLNAIANRSATEMNTKIADWNLKYAQEHNLPVGQLETYPSRIIDDVSKPGGILGRAADKVEKYMNRDGSLGNRFFNSIGDFLWRMNSMEERRRSKRW